MGVKALLQLAYSWVPMLLLIQKYSVPIKAANSVNASKRKHKNQINHYNKQINKDEYSWPILPYTRVN